MTVLIVGAGPTGPTLACRHVPFRIDKAAGVFPGSWDESAEVIAKYLRR